MAAVLLNLVDFKGVAVFADEQQRPEGFHLADEVAFIRVLDAETGELIHGVKKADALNSMVYRRVIGAPANLDGTMPMVTEHPRAVRIEWTPPEDRAE